MKIPSRCLTYLLLLLCSLTVFQIAAYSFAADAAKEAGKDAPRVDPGVIAAKVGDDAVYDREVEAGIIDALKGRPVSREALPKMQAEMLAKLVDRRLIMAYLADHQMGASKEEIELFIKQFTEKILGPQKRSLPDFLKDAKVSESEFRRQLSFQIAWNKYLKENISDEKLYAYFKLHQRDYDGTEVRVSHILLRPAGPVDPAVVEKLMEQAHSIRKEIESGSISVADAAKKYSAGPSRMEGGDLGFFPRHGVMVEPFAAAAFALEKGKLSEPVLTNFGVHLIYLTEVKQGTNTWDSVKGDLQLPFAQEEFEKIADEQRKVITPVFTGVVPYFKPGTTDVVVGKPSE